MTIGDAVKWGRVASRSLIDLPAVVGLHAIDERLSQRQMQGWSTRALSSLGVRFTIDDHNAGAYDDPPYLFVHLNQCSLLEIFIYPQVIPTPLRIVMNVEFALIPLLGAALALTGSRTIVRQWPTQAKRQMDRVACEMREQRTSFAMSVEGRRNPEGTLSPFKGGAAHLAIEAQARVVPFYIHGAHLALPFGQWRVVPGRVHGVALPIIDTRGMSQADRHDLTARVRALAETESKLDDPSASRTEAP